MSLREVMAAKQRCRVVTIKSSQSDTTCSKGTLQTKNMEELNKYSYKTLNVYQDAKKFVVDVYKLLKTFPSEERYALCDQIRRAAISVTSNITEGTSRFSKKEKAHFLEIAYASLMEVDSQLDISVELEYISLEEYKSIHGQVCAISRQLSALRTTILS
jgi:four helix bundle protein